LDYRVLIICHINRDIDIGVFKFTLEIVMLKKLVNTVRELPLRLLIGTTTLLAALPSIVLAASGDDPFGNMNVDPSQLQQTTEQNTSKTLEDILIGAGVFLSVIGVIGLVRIVSRTAEEKQEHGNSIISVFIILICIILGMTLVGIGWKGASANAGG